ncbi:MAG: AAA family ATPase [Myxococcales bacterium]|jgi:anion-transporting  ArsA/GET3 family ATPase|nr:AAA family ATPase [Myxococcales bacterium]
MLDAALERRLVFITGKGGVGRTAVATALALAAARAGKRTLVVELNPLGRLGEYLGDLSLGSEPTEITPELAAAAIAPAVIMEDFLTGMLRIRALARRLLESHTFRVVTAAAPGLADFLTLVRIAEWEGERTGFKRKRHRFDLVIVDAPATGHSVPLLATPGTLLKMLPFGPLTNTARDLALLLGDPKRAAVAIVTRAEEMAVNETLELATALMRIGVALLPVIVNAVDPFRFTRVEAHRLRVDPPDVPPAWQPYLGVARFALARQRTAERQIRRLTQALPERPVSLPHAPAGRITLAALEPLADAIARPHARGSRRVS